MKHDMKISRYKIKKFMKNAENGIETKPKKMSPEIRKELKLEGY